jgi:hypothetical protein
VRFHSSTLLAPLVSLICIGLYPSVASAQDYQPRFSQRAPSQFQPGANYPGQQNTGQLQDLISELNVLIGHGRRNNLANGQFLNQLDTLVNGYAGVRRNTILHDDFRTGNRPASNWRTVAGHFSLDRQRGLRSVVTPNGRTKSSGRDSSEQVAAALFGALLGQAAGNGNAPGTVLQRSQGHAGVVAPVTIPNQFSIEVEFSSARVAGLRGGRLELAPYQGSRAATGYRLAYNVNAAPYASLDLSYVSPRGGVATLGLYRRALHLEDNRSHILRWTRDGFGAQSVSLDGAVVMRATDHNVREGFNGFAIVNRGGDFAIREVRIEGG